MNNNSTNELQASPEAVNDFYNYCGRLISCRHIIIPESRTTMVPEDFEYIERTCSVKIKRSIKAKSAK